MARLAQDVAEMLHEQVEYRELLYQMTVRDLLLRYKQTVMGFGWAVFMPLVNTAVFSVIFMRVVTIETPVPYPLFAYCGFLAWNFSAATFRTAVTSLTSNAGLVTKVYFPREVFPISAMFVSLADLGVGSIVLIALMIWYRVPPSPYIVLLPVVVLVHAIFTAAVALFVAMANLFYRDVKYLFEVIITFWMFATSVVYPARQVGGRLGLVLRLNPMTAIIDAYRDVLFGRGRPEFFGFAITAVVAVIALGVAWLMFHRSEAQFAERI